MPLFDKTAAGLLISELEDSLSGELGGNEADTLSPEDRNSLLQELKEKLSPVKRSRAVVKRKITLLLKNILELSSSEEDIHITLSQLEGVKQYLAEVKIFDTKIEEIISNSSLLKYDSSILDEEIIEASHYHMRNEKLLLRMTPDQKTCSLSPASEHSRDDSMSRVEMQNILMNIQASKQEIKIPAIKCQVFKGEGDRHSFRSFLLSFQNIYGARKEVSDFAKLQFLKFLLEVNALKDIEHLPNVDENLEVALDILKNLYLDESYIIDSLFHKIDSAPNLDNKNLENIRIFLSEVRANLHELKEFGLNFFDVSSAGCKLMSHIIVDKLPSNFLRELKLLTQEEYPSLNHILDNYGRVLKSIEKGRVKNQASPKKERYSERRKQSKNEKKSASFNASVYSEEESSKYSKADKRAEVFLNEKRKKKFSHSPPSKCKFCGGKHRMIYCEKYYSPETKRERCRE